MRSNLKINFLFTFTNRFANICTYSSVSSNHNLTNLLLNMSKDKKSSENLQKVRVKLKEKGQKYTPGTITLKVLGSGARGAPRCLYMFTDQSRYLFNCGEGTQRLAHEHKMRLSKLEHIFVTHSSWENIGGLPGIALTIQDVGVPEITLHGPAGLEEIFPATRRFVVLKDLSVKMADCSESHHYEDAAMRVDYVALAGVSRQSCEVASDDTEEEDDDVDYYQHERKRKRCEEKRERKRGRVEEVSMSYICAVKDRPGMLSLEKCVEHRVPAGPLLGQLKSGLNVTLSDGTLVKSADVCFPTEPGPLFIVVECPTSDYLDSLLAHPTFAKHQSTASVESAVAQLVVHFTPTQVMREKRYVEWMLRFPPSTHHLVLNDSNQCSGSVAVHRIQHKLNLLHADIFPLLADQSIPTADAASSPLPTSKLADLIDKLAIIQGRTLCNFHLRPCRGLDRSEQLSLQPALYRDETMAVSGFKEALSLLSEQAGSKELYPRAVFLGTGSCIPNKTRNTSAILIHISASACILLDCGEGTFGQLVRLYGTQVDSVLRQLRAVYISHLHADHHIGLVGLIKGRRQACPDGDPLFLLAPKQIKSWLNFYHRSFEPITADFTLLPNGTLYLSEHKLAPDTESRLLKSLELSDISTVLVTHCPNAYGVALTHRDWKMCYSGDTMPCKELVRLGMDSDLLIHEATMEDDLEMEARAKLHSTTSQAIHAGAEMNARFTLLTHFSQRYAKLPRLNDSAAASNVGIAFDNMAVSLDQLAMLPRLYSALRLMFAEHAEELEQKSARRLMKRERENRAASNGAAQPLQVAATTR